jgi:hypothetical protein
MNTFSKKLKSLILIFIISGLISFLLCVFYPAKDRSLLFLKSLFVETPNVGCFNYDINNDKFTVMSDKHFLYIDNINKFIKNIEIKLKRAPEKNFPIKVFIDDIKAKKSFLILDRESNGFSYFNMRVSRKIKSVVIVIGNKIGDSFLLDSVVCNNDSFYFTDIDILFCFSQIKHINFWIRFIIFFVFLVFICLHFFFNINALYRWLYKKRYWVVFGIILFAVIFELNNSSIDLWHFLNTENPQENSDIILGKTRSIRSDEYATYTPMLLSQNPDYKYFSDSLRGGNTDVFMVYGQPIKNIVSVFRPFLLGFLFLGSAKGLSLFWILRLVLLFLISFEFLMLISNKNKIISLAGTFLITFAPAVQWWWTPSGIVEMIIYGELLILLLSDYIAQKSFIKRMIMIFFIMLFMGCYLLVLYPAWQVPMAYIFAIIGLWILVENYNNFKFDKKDILPISAFSILFILALVYIYSKSKGTIDLLSNTAYPGARFETGGDKYTEFDVGCNSFIHVFRYWGNMFFPLFSDNLKASTCNFSAFFDLFPIGLIVSCIVLFKDKIKDKLLIMFLCLYMFFTAWCVIGFPSFLAQITVMKVSPSYRTFVILGFLNVLILVRSISLLKYKMNKLYSSVISLMLVVVIVIANICIYGDYFDIFKIITVSSLSLALFYLILRNRINKLFEFLIMLIMIVSGLFVNPIQKGINVVTDLELSKIVKKIDAQEKGLWIFEGHNFILNNFLAFQKVRTLNCINTYPNFEFLKQLDEGNKYSNVYNRYANILMNLVHENSSMDKFVLLHQDAFLINITAYDILKLNINYVMSYRPLNEYSNDKINFEQLYFAKTRKCNIYIYKVKKL